MQGWIFLAVTIGLVWLSRRSLVSPRSHGFYRFFAWESITLLIILKLPIWFLQPFRWNQLISWACLLGSIWLAVGGFHLLRNQGQPKDDIRQDETLIGVEKTTQLITTGLYRHIRHPLYTSLLLLAFGVFFKQPDWIGIFLLILAVFSLFLTALREELENIAHFGDAYLEYQSKTKMFIPFIF